MASKSLTVDNKTFDISYEILNASCKKDIIFLHGWGSNKDIMKNVFSPFLKDFRHIYIDLPGFGKSPNEYELKTEDYVKITNEFLTLLNSTKDVIAGHSYGGKVATSLNPKNLVLLSSAGILEEKSCAVKAKIAFAKFFNALGLGKITKMFRSSDVSSMNEGMYATFKNVVNEDFSNSFKNYKNNALIFWGEKDSATSLESGKKIASLINSSTFISYDGDHYFFVKNAKDIAKRVENGIL
ncbi:alpha/beta fold hydrolase [Poseidonibacter ostreae]|uniref:Alpha/beta fold hydrolase n=1 Tax=Poseidonibacter ostreae TaxID=2654171 RepID=A0A6L4WSG0_9BACT|nr:alpha/beta hydrolase [Poseidonibacter ostreae]KAB7885133.1 alpha/beta fold hydrolase [Poseidonibacter ostreae]KAB7888839.1 alpha/beta fold hydrolase [Poseidonibacter ostreae]KAB7891236.1 alpha/beta fold hydrolase [Poseidonibacter ostreae]